MYRNPNISEAILVFKQTFAFDDVASIFNISFIHKFISPKLHFAFSDYVANLLIQTEEFDALPYVDPSHPKYNPLGLEDDYEDFMVNGEQYLYHSVEDASWSFANNLNLPDDEDFFETPFAEKMHIDLMDLTSYIYTAIKPFWLKCHEEFIRVMRQEIMERRFKYALQVEVEKPIPNRDYYIVSMSFHRFTSYSIFSA